MLLIFGTAGGQERSEEVVGDFAGSLWNGDRHSHLIGRFVNGKPKERAALGFLPNQLVNSVTYRRGIVEL